MARTDANITINKLIDAAGILFSNQGFDGVSVRDIASKAEVQLSAIGYHFKTKHNLYLKTLEYACEDILLPEDKIDYYIQKDNGLFSYIKDVLSYLSNNKSTWSNVLISREMVEKKSGDLINNYFNELNNSVKNLIVSVLGGSEDDEHINLGSTFLINFLYNFNDFSNLFTVTSNNKLNDMFNIEVLAKKIYNMAVIAMYQTN